MRFLFRSIRKKKFLYRLFWSYISVVVLLSSVSIVIYRSAYEDAWKRSEELGNRTAAACKKSVDALFLDVEQMALQIMQEKRIQTIESFQAPLTEDEKQEGILLASELSKYNISEGKDKQIYVYFPRSNMVVHQNGVYDASYIYKINYQTEDFSYQDFLALLNGEEKVSYTKLDSVVATAPKEELLVYTREVIRGQDHDQLARIVVCVQERELFQDTRILSEVENKMFVFNTDNEILFSSDKKYRDILEKEGFSAGENLTKRINHDKDTVVCLKSNVVDWYYAVVMQTDDLQKDAMRMERLVWYNILLLIAVGVVLVILLVRVNYKPVDEFLEKLREIGLPVDKRGDELEEVYKAVSTISEERHGLDAMLKKQNKMLRNHALRELLQGKKPDLDSLHEKYDIEFPYQDFVVCTFFAQNIDILFDEDDNIDDFERNELFFEIIKNIIEELMNREHRAYVTEVDDVITCIININDARKDGFLKDINLGFHEAREAVEKYFNVDIVAAMGEIHHGVEGIAPSYTESVQTMDYKIFMEIKGFTTYSSIPEHTQTEVYFSVESERRLINFMMIGDAAKAEDLLKSIFYINLMERALSVKSLNALMMKIVTIYMTVMQNPQINEESELHAEVSGLVEMIGTESFQTMQNQVLAILHKICEITNNRKTSRGNRRMEEIVAFIDQNYTVPGINVNTIAEHFGFNAAYLSKRFKDEVGESLLYYINKVRIKKAKELLKDGKLTNEEIAVQVGFTNLRTFNRVLKRYEGVSPGVYREGYHTS